MTIEQWLTVAMIIAVMITAIATAFGPIAAVLVQSRISQPKPTPVESQPKNLSQRSGGRFKRHLKWFGIFELGMLVNFVSLILELSKSTPIDRGSILIIALNVAGLSFIPLLMLLTHVIRAIELQGKFNDVTSERLGLMSDRISAAHEHFINLTKATTGLAEVTTEIARIATNKQPQGLLDRLQNELKKLLKD